MAVKDKVEMEEEIAAKVGDLKNTRIICRSGDPTDLYDLGILSPQTSRSVIVLSPETDDPDSQVIKTVLALVNDPNRRTAPYKIAAEIRDAGNAGSRRSLVGAKCSSCSPTTDLADRRPFQPPVRPQRRLFGTSRLRRMRDLHARPARLVGKPFASPRCPTTVRR